MYVPWPPTGPVDIRPSWLSLIGSLNLLPTCYPKHPRSVLLSYSQLIIGVQECQFCRTTRLQEKVTQHMLDRLGTQLLDYLLSTAKPKRSARCLQLTAHTYTGAVILNDSWFASGDDLPNRALKERLDGRRSSQC